MIPRAEWRLGFYTVAYCVAVWLCVQSAIAHSQAAFDAGDKSAFAWMGFFPYIFPLFCIEAGMFTLPVVVVLELSLAVAWYCGGAKWFL